MDAKGCVAVLLYCVGCFFAFLVGCLTTLGLIKDYLTL